MSKFPYPGLRPFQRDETAIFFGREEQVDQLLDKLDESRFLAVVGPSGCGKSSLVKAGILPALDAGFLANVGVRWHTVEVRPGNCPMRKLAEVLLKKSALGQERKGHKDSTAFLLATLRRGPQGLLEALNETPLSDGANLLILVDQFEELFRYARYYNIDEADAFVALLLASVKQKNIPVFVVITMRSDFLGDCALFSGLPEAMNENLFLTPRLTRKQGRAAIVAPARVFGGNVDARLVNHLLNEMRTDPDQLPVLQHCLMRMWYQAMSREGLEEKDIQPAITGLPNVGGITITWEDYDTVGRLKDALSIHADQAFDELKDKKQKHIAETMFRCLSERGPDQRDTRRPVQLREVASVAKASPAEVTDVAEVFRRSDRCFITPPAGVPLGPDSVLDISHESLIRQWQRMNEWVEQEAKSAEIYRRLEQTACLWKQGHAALWTPPDLDIALNWKKWENPKAEWAGRYGKNFGLAMEFLDESEKKWKEEQREKEEARQQKLKQTRKRLAVAIVGLIIAVCLAGWAFWERTRAGQLERQRTHDLFESYLTHASMLARIEDYETARKILKESRQLDLEIPSERRHARNLLAWFVDLMGGLAEKVYEEANVELQDVAVSSDGSLLAGVGEHGTVVLFDVESGDLIKRLTGHENRVEKVIFHPKGKWLATAGLDGRIILWNLPDGEKFREWNAPDKVRALALSPDGSLLASGGKDCDITVWDIEKGEALFPAFSGHLMAVRDLAFSPDRRLLASASDDHTARIWDIKTGESLSLSGHTAEVQSVAFHPEGKILATGSSDKDIRLWYVRSGNPKDVFQGHKNAVQDLAFVDSGNYLVSADFDRTLRIWDTESGITLRVLQGHTLAVMGIAAIGDRLFSASDDGTLRLWDINLETSPGSMKILDLAGGPGTSSAIAPDGLSVAVGCEDGSLHFYTLPDIRLIWEKADAHENVITRLAFSPDGNSLASASFDKTVKLWQVSDGRLEQTFSGHTNTIHAVAFSPDGRTLATADYDGKIGFFEVGKGDGRFYPAHEGKIASIAFDPGGQRLLSTGIEDGRTRLWKLDTFPLTLLRDFPKTTDQVLWATFSPDGSRIASVGRGATLGRILKTDDGSEEQSLVGHENAIFRAAFSPDGWQIATVGGDVTVRFWDLLSEEPELFTIHLPMKQSGSKPEDFMGPWDFDFRCTFLSPTAKNVCWIAVPLSYKYRGKLVLYHLSGIYE